MFSSNLKTETPPSSKYRALFLALYEWRFVQMSLLPLPCNSYTYPYVHNYCRTCEKKSMKLHVQRSYWNLSTRQDFSFTLNNINGHFTWMSTCVLGPHEWNRYIILGKSSQKQITRFAQYPLVKQFNKLISMLTLTKQWRLQNSYVMLIFPNLFSVNTLC
jgi:hypothetical protein